MMEILQFEFMQNAFMAAVLASIACGFIGSYVVIKRIVFVSGGIAHATFGGIGLGYYLGINPLVVVTPFSLVTALLIGVLAKKTRVAEDSAIGMLWSAGMAIGILLIGLTPGYAPDLFSYLFGSILTVPRADIYLMLLLDAVIVVSVFVFYYPLLGISFDEEYTRTRGVPAFALYLFLLCLIALTIVVLIRIVGIILVISLLTVPPMIGRLLTYNLKTMIVLSCLFGVLFTTGGLVLSYFFELSSGATIVLFSIAVYFVVIGIRSVLGRLAIR